MCLKIRVEARPDPERTFEQAVGPGLFANRIAPEVAALHDRAQCMPGTGEMRSELLDWAYAQKRVQ